MNLGEVAISDLGRIVTGKTPSTKNPAFFDGDYQFVTPSDLDWRTYYCQTTERSVTDEARKSHQNQFVPADAVMVTCIGNTIGKCAISTGECLTNQQINTIVPAEAINPKFIYYLLIHNTDLIRGAGLGGGAATPILNKTAFSRMRLRVPPQSSWDGIASILSVYDDLIENNRRRIQLLDQAARLLFREWFVHLRFPGHEHVTVTEGIPAGWKEKTLEELTTTVTKGTTPTTLGRPFVDDGVNYIKVESINDTGIIVKDKLAKVDDETHDLLRRSQIAQADILFTIAGAIGRTALVPDWVLPANTNQAVAIIRPRDSEIAYYLYWVVRSHEFQSFSKGRVVQTAQANVSLTALKSAVVTVPSDSVMKLFIESIKPIHKQIAFLSAQIHKAKEARDLILPRLIRGELVV